MVLEFCGTEEFTNIFSPVDSYGYGLDPIHHYHLWQKMKLKRV